MATGPPRIADLSPSVARTICIVVLHAPQPAPEGHTSWRLSLVNISGAVVAREHVLEPPFPNTLSELARPSLRSLGRRVHGSWTSDHDAAGQTRHRARII